MLSSAIASSSRVLMPGTAAARSSSSVSPTSRPATRINATCSGVLIWMDRAERDRAHMGSAGGRSAHRGRGRVADGLEQAGGDGVDLAHAVDLHEQAAVGVDARERLGLGGVDLEAVRDDLGGVVGATLDLGTREQSADDLVVVGGQFDDDVQ